MLNNFRRLYTRKSIENVVNYSKTLSLCTICSNPRMVKIVQLATQISQNHISLHPCRYKSKGDKFNKKKQNTESESDEAPEDNFLDNVQDKNTKTLKVNVTSMRMDGIVKAGLGLSRNKIEVIFYESKIRVNGEKVLKKSTHINEGDEIDVIKGVNINNPDFLTVARIEILSVTPNEESISIKLRRFKSLTIENYKGSNSWQS